MTLHEHVQTLEFLFVYDVHDVRSERESWHVCRLTQRQQIKRVLGAEQPRGAIDVSHDW